MIKVKGNISPLGDMNRNRSERNNSTPNGGKGKNS